MANKFIKEDYDKFSNKKTVEMNNSFPIPFGSSIDVITCIELYWRHISLPSGDTLLLDAYYEGKNWFFLKNGSLTFNINDVENVVLEPHSVYSKTEEKAYTVACKEYVYYEVEPELLKKICEAKSVDFRIKGNNYVDVGMDLWKDLNFITYSQRFYNGLYDENAYTESLIEPAKTENSSSGSGCVVTLISLITALSSIAALLIFVIGYLNL